MSGPTEHALYTWDPVSAAWVHERGPEIPPPPRPPDVHALQSYFFDEDGKEWIRTVLAPMGRELAAKWQGAHRIPEGQLAAPAKVRKGAAPERKKSGGALGAFLVFVVLLVMLGGAGVVASQAGLIPGSQAVLGTLAPSTGSSGAPAASDVPATTGATGATGSAPVPTTAPAPVPTTAPAPVPTTAPAPVVTRAPVVNVPAGPRATLGDGTTVVYTGATTASRGGFLAASFTVIAPTGRPATGELTIVLGDLAKDPRIVSGLLDANGRIALDVPATLAVGQYPLSIVYKGSRATLTTITIK